MKYSVSIIVPIYNVEKYISRCVISLFEQDFENIEYIFVNDCTPDNSLGILKKVIEKYPNRKPYIKIINHKNNKGSGAARNTGVQNCTGDYTIQIDSDDWCELDMISTLYSKAKATNADIVVCDYFINYKKKEIYHSQDYSFNREENLKNILVGKISPSLWNKLIRKNLYVKNNIYPPLEISTAEDRWLVIRLFSISNNIAYVPKAFLHYWQENPNSLTTKIRDKVLEDLKWYAHTTQCFLQNKGLSDYKKYLYMDCLLDVIYLSRNNNYKKNIEYVLPESNKLTYLWQHPSLHIISKLIYSFSILGFHSVSVLYIRLKEFKF